MRYYRRKISFLQEARENIRAGLWYKPSWWDAVRTAPPPPIGGGTRKRDIPRLRFAEAALTRKFAAENPMLAKSGAPIPGMLPSAFASVNKQPNVSAAFVRKQIAEMDAGSSTAEAEQAARDWLLKRVRLPNHAGRVHIPMSATEDRLEFTSSVYVKQAMADLKKQLALAVNASVAAEPVDAAGSGTQDDTAPLAPASKYIAFGSPGYIRAVQARDWAAIQAGKTGARESSLREVQPVRSDDSDAEYDVLGLTAQADLQTLVASDAGSKQQ